MYECACARSGGDLARLTCPACTLVEVVESRRDAGAGDSDFLFVDGSSQQCSAGAITATWNALAAGRITDDLGHPSDRPLTKHSARRAGAQLLIRRGRPLAEVQYMG